MTASIDYSTCSCWSIVVDFVQIDNFKNWIFFLFKSVYITFWGIWKTAYFFVCGVIYLVQSTHKSIRLKVYCSMWSWDKDKARKYPSNVVLNSNGLSASGALGAIKQCAVEFLVWMRAGNFIRSNRWKSMSHIPHPNCCCRQYFYST